jgi:membrane-bound lytic murein transglycosylase A
MAGLLGVLSAALLNLTACRSSMPPLPPRISSATPIAKPPALPAPVVMAASMPPLPAVTTTAGVAPTPISSTSPTWVNPLPQDWQISSAELIEPPAQFATPRGHWVASDWSALPGWNADNLVEAWPALLRSCERPHAAWRIACQMARSVDRHDEIEVREFFRTWLRPWRVEAFDGQASGMMTGYFEPFLEASRVPTRRFCVPLYAPPADLGQRKPWYSRAQIDALASAQAALRGREIAWLADPIDALVLHIQGSGRLMLQEPDGQSHLVRMAFAGHNEQPYQSVGRWLVEQGAFTLEQASWSSIRTWARDNPGRVREMMAANPRYVFFREEALPNPNVGPNGAQGVPLTPGRSIAVDRDSIPYGTPVWLASTEPSMGRSSGSSSSPTPRPLQRMVVAQDTGGAIVGAVRADYFWGWGSPAEDSASRTKQPLRLWAIWPR